MNREHGVYKYVYNDEVIYVGKTDAENGFKKRIDCHKKENELFNKSDIYVYKCKDKTETDSLETILINAYKPVLNKMKVYDYKIDPPELKWVPWKNYYNKNKIVSLEQALLDLENSNITRTINGKSVTWDYSTWCIFPHKTDRLDLVSFCDDGSISISGCCLFPTKNLLLKMKDQIDNMIENYDVFQAEFKEFQIDLLRKGLNEKGYVLDIDIDNVDLSWLEDL